MNKETKKLSSKEYWDDVLSNGRIPFEVHSKQYSTWLIDSFFNKYIQKNTHKTLFEAGAGSSAWLPYLSKKYNLTVSGLDYSETGCRICEENLKLLKIKYDEIICEDIFKWHSDKKYDIIISLGLIEHFDNPFDVLKILSNHINPSGIIITVIPNLLGISGKLTKNFLPEVYKIHKIISEEELKAIHEKAGFITLKCNYTGFFYPMIIPLQVKKSGFFFKESTIRRNISIKMFLLLNILITKILRALQIKPASKTFSPFIIYVGKSVT